LWYTENRFGFAPFGILLLQILQYTATGFFAQIALLPGETSFRFAQKTLVLLLQFEEQWGKA
jgi:hypothetical protein